MQEKNNTIHTFFSPLSFSLSLSPPLPPSTTQFDKPVSAQHLKLIILQGFEHFVFVYSVSVNGTPVQ